MKKIRECREYGCTEPPYQDGLCEKHDEEKRKNNLQKAIAIETLHTALVDGRLPENHELQEELIKIRKWWHKACDSVNNNIEHNMLRDEANNALDWCIAIAQEIIDGELAYRQGVPEKLASKEIKRLVWERFENLEAGLMSNGVSRTRS